MGLFGSKSKRTFVPAANLKAKKTVSLRYGTVGKPAANVSLIKKNGLDFEKKVNSAVNMQKSMGVGGLAWDVIAIIDESGSMSSLFRDGTVQSITERALAWTAAVDADGMAPVGGFASGFKWHGEVDLTNVIGCASSWGTWGGTDLTAGLKAAFDVAKEASNPVYLFVVTDGAPDNQSSVIQMVSEMSEYPIFIKILLVGNDSRGKAFVEYLDDLESKEPGRRLFDNVDAQHIQNVSGTSDDKFNRAMTEELAEAVTAMKNAGLAR